jgi:hypothetical protein
MAEMVADRKSEQADILQRLRANPRVDLVRIAGPRDCSTAQTVQGAYAKEDIPELPIEGCSRADGCICAYKPVLNDIYP